MISINESSYNIYIENLNEYNDGEHMEDIEKLYICLIQLEGLRLDTLIERKILQKEIYFVQQFGLDLGYSFGFYVYGPYSPELTDDAYFLKKLIKQAPDTIGESKLSEDEQKALALTKKFLNKFKEDNIEETAYYFELLSSLHFLWNFSYMKSKTMETVFHKLLERKHIHKENDLKAAWSHLNGYNLLKHETTL